ncbi:gamma-glutamylcyclotransferase family protein [Flavobacterium sp.]|uniref:gamma-glutamylcyclotransferase family protein n=1 Tax=Flavobacterium sp. TaxID=239 RepID=UPI00262710B4|nr:gamma-glutamylcyclotransferase family protein [Flavobacterium sp.]MDG2431114.1 gamma-glutamylcyclotransferase [Flavobacterium sp.]
MAKLFAYGTLREKDIQENIFGRSLTGTAQSLLGYSIQTIQIEEEFGVETYPIITPTDNKEDVISGIVYELSEKDLELADTYEGKYYRRIEVQLQSQEKVWVYSAVN